MTKSMIKPEPGENQTDLERKMEPANATGEEMLQRVVDALKVKNEAEAKVTEAYRAWSAAGVDRDTAEEEVSAAIKELTAAIDRGDVVLEVVVPESA